MNCLWAALNDGDTKAFGHWKNEVFNKRRKRPTKEEDLFIDEAIEDAEAEDLQRIICENFLPI
jgi:hypothetical protein